MVKIPKHTLYIILWWYNNQTSFVKISQLLKKLPTDTRRKTSVKQ